MTVNEGAGPRIALVMSGGSALGAFHAGAYEALHDHGLRPSWIAGSSAGAVTAALIAGNVEHRRVEVLKRFWQEASVPVLIEGLSARYGAVLQARLFGRPTVFTPIRPFSIDKPALYDLSPLISTLARLADFGLVNDSATRVMVHTTCVASGEPVVFDTSRTILRPEHIAASCSLPLDFEPITIDGHVLCDGGMSSNLPIRDLLVPPPKEPMICFALNLFYRRGTVPRSLELMASRLMDLCFASQADKDLELTRMSYEAQENLAPVMVAHVIYDGCGEMVGQKMFDFSADAIKARWRAGRDAMTRMIAALPQMPQSGYVEVEVEGRA